MVVQIKLGRFTFKGGMMDSICLISGGIVVLAGVIAIIRMFLNRDDYELLL